MTEKIMNMMRGDAYEKHERVAVWKTIEINETHDSGWYQSMLAGYNTFIPINDKVTALWGRISSDRKFYKPINRLVDIVKIPLVDLQSHGLSDEVPFNYAIGSGLVKLDLDLCTPEVIASLAVEYAKDPDVRDESKRRETLYIASEPFFATQYLIPVFAKLSNYQYGPGGASYGYGPEFSSYHGPDWPVNFKKEREYRDKTPRDSEDHDSFVVYVKLS